MRKNQLKFPRIFFVSSYPPRRCGIATFTFDLVRAVSELQGPTGDQRRIPLVAALNDIAEGYDYPQEVVLEINQQQPLDYRKAADFINSSPAQVVCLQHEFGIFGGRSGIYILDLLENLKKPVVTTLHRMLRAPDREEFDVLRSVCRCSTFVVVLAKRAVEFLKEIYGVPREKIFMIHHGAPNVPFFSPSQYKDKIEAQGRPLILTSGLINPNKGIETAIEAMVLVARELPEVLYLILGATHPRVLRGFGEKYRLSLERRVAESKLRKQVRFQNRFVSSDELFTYLAAADIYLTPYPSKEQISSGTLTQALAFGKAVISTPYWYAQELLAYGRGCIIPFGDVRAMAEEIIYLLKNDRERDALRRKAYQFSRRLIWPRVARAYLALFRRAIGR